MVDALKEIWRALKPAGNLIDLRPRAAKLPLDILYKDDITPVGWVDDSRDQADDIAADIAIAKTVSQGYFVLERKTTFPYLMYWDTLEALAMYVAERWRSAQLDETTVDNARHLLVERGPAAKLRTCREMQIAFYHKRS